MTNPPRDPEVEAAYRRDLAFILRELVAGRTTVEAALEAIIALQVPRDEFYRETAVKWSGLP